MTDKNDSPTIAATLRLSPDKVRVLLDCPDPHDDLDRAIADILEACTELKLPRYPDEDFLRNALHRICPPGEDVQDVTLMMATPPVLPRDGQMKWSRDYFIGGWDTDPTGEQVDFWAKLDNRAVAAGEKLLEVTSAVAGEPGCDVYDNKIAVQAPTSIKVRCGKGVSESAPEPGLKVFTAAVSGRLRFADNTVTVDELYQIKGDVCLETGNVVHTGSVLIEGDVKSGASLMVDGDVVIKGLLEPANVRVGGSLTVHGGIIGSPESEITVDDEVVARYAREATIRAGGNVIVTGEINYCDIESAGRVDASTGRIIGGRTYARMGIVVGEAGASGASQTILAAGTDPTLAKRLATEQTRIRKMEKARSELESAIRKTCRDEGPLSEAESAFVDALVRKSQALEREIETHQRKTSDLAVFSEADTCEEVYMLKECWSGTIVQLNGEKCRVRSSVMRPRLAKLVDGSVRILPLGEDNGPDQT